MSGTGTTWNGEYVEVPDPTEFNKWTEQFIPFSTIEKKPSKSLLYVVAGVIAVGIILLIKGK